MRHNFVTMRIIRVVVDTSRVATDTIVRIDSAFVLAHGLCLFPMERMPGTAPSSPAWKAGTSLKCFIRVAYVGTAPTSRVFQALALLFIANRPNLVTEGVALQGSHLTNGPLPATSI